MPHQCLKCESVFDNTSDVIIKGCPNCGAKLFLFIKKAPVKEEEFELSQDQKDIILKEVESFVDIKDTDIPIILKLENIRVLAPGKYEIDINQLMKKDKPLIYKIQEGTYVIDIDFLRGVERKNDK
jgi:predicted  nucleic acid-binding Zn-ribbon protein